MNVRRCHVDVRGEFMLNVSIHSDASPPSPSYLCPRCQSVHFSFLCLRLMSDTESSTLKWRTCSPFPKVKMRYGLRIPIATDQMNGGDLERLISLSQSAWRWRSVQRPRERTTASEILPAIPLAAEETSTRTY